MIPKRIPIVISAVAMCCLSAWAQKPVQFEVASIKPMPSTATELSSRQGTHFDSGRLSMPCGNLASLISWAYDLKDVRMEGAPGWATSSDSRYAVEAKAEDAASPEQMRVMLQALLAERFQLKVHRDRPVRPVFALVVAKGGAKLRDAEPDTGAQGHVRFAMAGKAMVLTGAGSSMSELIAWMKSIAPEQPIMDETRLTGAYDFNLQWLPEADQPTVAFFSAIEDQLGLKLEDRKAPVDVLVIDHAEKPTPN